MKPVKALGAVLLLFAATSLTASGPIGLYGIVEKVVFEPNEQAPERVQVWGAFAYAEGAGASAFSPVRVGYLYFKLPDVIPGFRNQSAIDTIKKEWADLKAVSATGEAVAFGRWTYIAGFGSLDPAQRPVPPSVILHSRPQGGDVSDLRVRPATEPPSSPAVYETNAGIVKIPAQGNQAGIVKQLKDALKR